ncbi:MAG: hypothetical protein GTN62_14630 [Gemmatimonadales bacterium]|nr:hypothetical protein [Gemmatimonadales bacterium]NIN13320.1 hypothetical protein [Gemmatimonadales bacterium]NIN51323.1 hypothetical protein [Gemmatimonadales bacterium]NIP08787.1 hypothetical protein [Gemmatimonadales bacterium]NIQ99781.1 hypothetical protein [Gemmatimonadales bacterium]
MITLPERPAVSSDWKRRALTLFERTRGQPPPDLSAVVREELNVDLTARYGGLTIPHPFGKASGQLSCTASQVEADVAAGLAFIVLKTVIAEAADGSRSMEAWTIPESRMRVERRTAPDGRVGWTVSWRGRGWPGTLDEYLQFFAESLELARERDTPIVPSVKYHLPEGDDTPRTAEYQHTTKRLLEVWDRAGCGGDMLLEKDFSPTLAGDARASDRDRIVGWLEQVPPLVHQACGGRVRLGVKVMNALFDDAFQVEMIRVLAERCDPPPAYLVVFNRLYDPKRELAYGGWELSDRNLRVLDAARQSLPSVPSLSATGNICSGRMMVEYALRGCENGQIHTFFQLPLSQYTATGGDRSARALHTLMLHPTDGLVAWLRHLHEAGHIQARGGAIRFLDVVDAARGR